MSLIASPVSFKETARIAVGAEGRAGAAGQVGCDRAWLLGTAFFLSELVFSRRVLGVGCCS